MFIGCEDFFASAEGADEHEQGGLWQVEVRQQRLHHFEFETYFWIWIDEKVGCGWAGDDGSSASTDRVFESANRGGADGDDSAPAVERVIDGGGGAGGNGIRLGVEFVILNTIDADWLESSEADVQRDLGSLDAALTNSVENLWSEMETGGGRRYRSALLGINGLIALAIAERIRARDVGRERDVADAIEHGEKVIVILEEVKANVALAEFSACEDLGLQFIGVQFILIAEKEAFADSDLAAGTNQALPVVGIDGELAGQKNFDAAVKEIASGRIARANRLGASAFAAAEEPRWKDAGVVENDEIAGLQKVRKFTEQAIRIIAAGSLQAQHAGAVAGGEGFLGDEFAGKVEVEIGNPHGSDYKGECRRILLCKLGRFIVYSLAIC